MRKISQSLILDIDASPWESINRNNIKPLLKHYHAEIIRRHEHGVRLRRRSKSSGPRPRSWTILKCQEWLNNNPITTTADKEFLVQTVNSRKAILEAAQAEKANEDDKLEGGNWMGAKPYLRLIHAIIDNPEIRNAFIRRDKIIDARGIL